MEEKVQDQVIEGEKEEAKGEDLLGRIKALEEELEEARAQAQENYDKYVRLYAEFENYRKRVAREKAELVKYGNEELLKEILPVVDNLEKALEHAHKGDDPYAIVQGVELILEQLRGVLKRFGVEPIEAVGERFDPERHEAVGEKETEGAEPGEVLFEVQKGYMLNDRLLRPAKVVVAKERQQKAEDGS